MLKKLFDLDRKGLLSSERGAKIFDEIIERSIEQTDDDSAETSESESDSGNDRFFKKTWAGSQNILDEREQAIATYTYKQNRHLSH